MKKRVRNGQLKEAEEVRARALDAQKFEREGRAGFGVLPVASRSDVGVFVGGKVETKTDFDNESVGRIGTLTAAVLPPLAGRVMLGDSEWTAESERPIEAGANVRVVAQQNLTMKVEEI